jgi:hypothetical protein
MTWPRAFLACVVALVGGAVIGWRLKPDPPPGVDLEVALRAASSWRTRTTTVTVAGPVTEGPVRIVERWRTAAGPTPPPAPGCAPCPACDEHERIEERGPVERGAVSTTSTSEGSGSSVAVAREKLVLTPPPPAPRPGWGLSAAALLSRDGVGAQLGAGRRLIGPVWLEATVSTVPAASLGLRVEF